MILRYILCVVVFLGSSLAQAGGLDDVGRQRVLKALQDGVDPNVQSLSANDVLVLKAIVALDDGETRHALDILSAQRLKKDPLLAILEAEAYRRSALEAVEKAGGYAKNLTHQQELLKDADLSSGLREANVRLSSLADKLDGVAGFPLDLLQVDARIYSVFLVDKARSRLFVYARDGTGNLVRVADEYVVTGFQQGDKHQEGDARTPNGIYRFVRRLQGRSLDVRYGPVAYPIDYPNSLDHLHHKDGSGIWLHGYAEGVGRRPPRDTKGCFALPNSRLLAVSKYVQLGKSWVIVGEDFKFNDDRQRDVLKASVKESLEAWRKDWSALNTPAYLAHYHKDFHSGRWNLAAWKRYKMRVNAKKSFVDVKISHLTLIHDPNEWREGEVVVAEFDQAYRSDNYQDMTHKRIYWVRKDRTDAWKILLEEML